MALKISSYHRCLARSFLRNQPDLVSSKLAGVVTVEADSPDAAAKRAKQLLRSVGSIRDDEDVGEWCDADAPARPRVRNVFGPKYDRRRGEK